jgi:hypothetical protein
MKYKLPLELLRAYSTGDDHFVWFRWYRNSVVAPYQLDSKCNAMGMKHELGCVHCCNYL